MFYDSELDSEEERIGRWEDEDIDSLPPMLPGDMSSVGNDPLSDTECPPRYQESAWR